MLFITCCYTLLSLNYHENFSGHLGIFLHHLGIFLRYMISSNSNNQQK